MAQAEQKKWGLASRAVHADDNVSSHRAVAPPMHVSTTFAYDTDPSKLVPNENVDVSDSERSEECRLPPTCSSSHLHCPSQPVGGAENNTVERDDS